MVLTRLSHFGEVCPLSDHSYSDPAAQFTSVVLPSNRRVSGVGVGSKSPSGLALPSGSPADPQAEQSLPADAAAPQEEEVVKLHILDLPNEIFEKIFSYLTYKNIGEIRRTCKRFEQIGSNILNAAFQRLQHLMSQRFQAIKGQMPRRESARRKHPLVREHDIVETLHMRLMLLQMSFGKHIERKHCCFFAGDILDEVHRILWYIKNTPTLGRAYKVTDELFDLSSMAMEYFKEHIEPRLPEITCFGSDFLDITTRYSDGCSVRPSGGSARVSEPEDDIPEFDTLPPSNMVLRKRIRRIRQGMRRYNTQLVALKRELKSCKSKLTDQHKQMMEYATRMDEYDKKFEESSRKFSTVLQELNKCKTELQYWRSKSPAHPLLCYGCGQAVGEGANQQLQAGVLMQGGDETVVFVPLAKASSQEGGESATPSAVFGRCSGRSGLCAMNGSVRNLERVFDLELSPSETSAVEPASHSKVVPETLPLVRDTKPESGSEALTQSQSLSQAQCLHLSSLPSTPASQNSSSSTSPNTSTSQTSLSQAGVPLALSPVTPTSVSSPPIAPSHTHSTLPGTLPHVHSQPYSAFHTCGASHQTEQHRWDSSQECAEDLSMSRSFKHDLYDDGECGTLKRRVSDEESDNCDTSDDTVGRRVKERKRIKLDVL